MSLDAPKSDAELLALLARRTGATPPPAAAPTHAHGRPIEPKRIAAKERTIARDYEHGEQVAFFCWAARNAQTVPALAKLFAIPNGGYRNIITAARLKAEGVKPGIPDVMLLVPLNGNAGLMIEMKRPGGVLSPSQADWHCAFMKDGFRVALATTWQQARDHVCAYLDLDPTRVP